MGNKKISIKDLAKKVEHEVVIGKKVPLVIEYNGKEYSGGDTVFNFRYICLGETADFSPRYEEGDKEFREASSNPLNHALAYFKNNFRYDHIDSLKKNITGNKLETSLLFNVESANMAISEKREKPFLKKV